MKSQKTIVEMGKKKLDCITQKKAHGRRHFKTEIRRGVIMTHNLWWKTASEGLL